MPARCQGHFGGGLTARSRKKSCGDTFLGCASAVFYFLARSTTFSLPSHSRHSSRRAGWFRQVARRACRYPPYEFLRAYPLEHGENQLQMPELAAIKARDLENELLGSLLGNAFALQIEDALLTLQRLDGIAQNLRRLFIPHAQAAP